MPTDDKTCNWCGHAKAEHSMQHRLDANNYANGCFGKLANGRFCQCSAERGRVKKARKSHAE